MFRRRSSTTDPGERTPYNNTFGKLNRINEWWLRGFEAKIMGDIPAYYNCLETIYTEVSPHLTPEEQESIYKRLREIEKFLDSTNIPSGGIYDQLKSFNVRKGSNLCDGLARVLSGICHKYNLEWFDVEKWSRDRLAAEPVMRG
jgi:hypothetical protein